MTRVWAPAMFAVFVLAATLGEGIAAAEPKFEFGTGDDVKKVEWKATAQAGVVMTTGNSRTTTLNLGASATRKDRVNKLGIDVAAAYAKSQLLLASDDNMDGRISETELEAVEQTSTESYSLKIRYDRFFTAKNSLFATGIVSADEPAGKELVAGGQLGYARNLLKDRMHDLSGEAGYDFTYENLVAEGDAVQIHSARVFLGYTGTLSPDTAVGTSLEALFNLNEEETPAGDIPAGEDTRMTAKLSVTTKLHKDISFRFGFTAKWDQAPAPRGPVGALPFATGFTPLADELDTTTEATLIVSIF